MTFAWPWIAVLLPVVFLVSRRKRNANDSHDAIEHPSLFELAQHGNSIDQPQKYTIGYAVIGCLLVLALARPQWVGEPLDVDQRGRSLYLAVDLSESMLEQDMLWNQQPVSRYQAMQAVISEFVTDRTGDFVGLVVFGSFADVQAPLTPDLQAVQGILRDLRPGMADSRTAIGDGLALAVKQLRDSATKDKVIILLSDGESNSGQITPEEATRVAKSEGIRVYTIGFGGEQNALFQSFGLRSSALDEQTLRSIAEQTDGRYFRAASSTALTEVFEEIDRLEPSDQKTETQRQVTELYWVALLLIGVFLSLLHLKAWLAWRHIQ